jgi:hypothetical protein
MAVLVVMCMALVRIARRYVRRELSIGARSTDVMVVWKGAFWCRYGSAPMTHSDVATLMMASVRQIRDVS